MDTTTVTAQRKLSRRCSLGLSLEKLVKQTNGAVQSVTYRHYVSAGGRTVAQIDVPADTDPMSLAPTVQSERHYFIHDHLGSVAVVFGHDGGVQERLFYDPWGRRRNAGGTLEGEFTNNSHVANRGYTMHEHLPSLGMINMNGRFYDPMLGRFMGADSILQDPSDLQAHNRYAYVRNNPLRYTDATGHCFGLCELIVAYLWDTLALDAFVAVQSTVIAVTTAAQAGAIIGFTGSLIASGGDFDAALKGGINGFFSGAFSGGVYFGVGQALSIATAGMGPLAEMATKVAAHAGAGCLVSSVTGSSCQSGAAAAAVSKFFTPTTDDFAKSMENKFGSGDGSWRQATGAVTSAIIGGTASVAAGGKFANGALNAMYGYLYNFLSNVHKSLTLDAGILAGLHPSDALALAVEVKNADFVKGSQSPENAHWHD